MRYSRNIYFKTTKYIFKQKIEDDFKYRFLVDAIKKNIEQTDEEDVSGKSVNVNQVEISNKFVRPLENQQDRESRYFLNYFVK